MNSSASEAGSFSHSFIVHMIRDFFVLLIAVAVIELGIRFLLVVYHFDHEEKLNTQIAAERLAEDLKSVMLNSGGPVAARTLFPILQRNHQNMGLNIAINPAPVTIASIESVFGFRPAGIPAAWPNGKHHEFTVELQAEKSCLSCHTKAQLGDVLGSITVRNYFSTHLLQWWEDVRVTGTLGMGKAVVHTIVLFFLLKVRMESLTSLRSMIAQLAKGGSDLSHRASVKSLDEFGELARDLNSFLDRISHVIEDLQKVLNKIGALNQRLGQIHNQMCARLRRLDAGVTVATREAFENRGADPFLSENWVQSIEVVLATLQLMTKEHDLAPELEDRLSGVWDRFRESTHGARDVLCCYDRTMGRLIDLSRDLHDFVHFMKEMEVLEEQMRGIADTGRTLVRRLGSGESAMAS